MHLRILALPALLFSTAIAFAATTPPAATTATEDIPTLFADFAKTVNLLDATYCTLKAIDGKTYVCLAREEKTGPLLSYNCRTDAGCWPRLPGDAKPATP